MDVRLFRIVTGEEVIAEVVDENASTCYRKEWIGCSSNSTEHWVCTLGYCG